MYFSPSNVNLSAWLSSIFIIWFILYRQSYSCYTLLENLTHLKFLQANHGFSCFCILMFLFLSFLDNFHIDGLLLLFSHVQLFATPCISACRASLSFTISRSLLKLMSIESMMPSNPISLCHTLLLLPSIFPSIRAFSNEPALHIRWPKYWSVSFHISPSSEYSGLTFFRMDWFELLAVQGTHKSLLQHHTLKAMLQCSVFFGVHFSHPYMTTGNTIALTIRTFVGKVMSLLFNTLIGLSNKIQVAQLTLSFR